MRTDCCIKILPWNSGISSARERTIPYLAITPSLTNLPHVGLTRVQEFVMKPTSISQRQLEQYLATSSIRYISRSSKNNKTCGFLDTWITSHEMLLPIDGNMYILWIIGVAFHLLALAAYMMETLGQINIIRHHKATSVSSFEFQSARRSFRVINLLDVLRKPNWGVDNELLNSYLWANNVEMKHQKIFYMWQRTSVNLLSAYRCGKTDTPWGTSSEQRQTAVRSNLAFSGNWLPTKRGQRLKTEPE